METSSLSFLDNPWRSLEEAYGMDPIFQGLVPAAPAPAAPLVNPPVPIDNNSQNEQQQQRLDALIIKLAERFDLPDDLVDASSGSDVLTRLEQAVEKVCESNDQ